MLTPSEALRLFRIINAGCRIHPTYQAVRQPRVSCKECKDMWDARLKLRAASTFLKNTR